jgi:hypothetical protein
MFEIIKLKIKSFSLSRKRKSKVFVNPYATQRPEVNEKLNPYVTDYGTKKPRTVQEIIFEKLQKSKEVKEVVEEKPIVFTPPVLIIQEPSFFADMKEVFIGDLMWIARRKPKPQIVEEPFSIYESDTS